MYSRIKYSRQELNWPEPALYMYIWHRQQWKKLLYWVSTPTVSILMGKIKLLHVHVRTSKALSKFKKSYDGRWINCIKDTLITVHNGWRHHLVLFSTPFLMNQDLTYRVQRAYLDTIIIHSTTWVSCSCSTNGWIPEGRSHAKPYNMYTFL